MNGVSKKTRRSMLIAAALILSAAIIWLVLLESRSYTRAVCRRLEEFGYRLSPADFYTQGFGAGTSISRVVGVDLTEAAELSRACGFPGDTEKTGLVELMLCRLDGNRVLYVYVVDREPELVFIEDVSSGTLAPVNGK